MITRTINTYTDGIAEDLREPSTTSFSTCKGFDSTTHAHKLVPYSDLEAEALTSGDITDNRFSDIIRGNSGLLIAVGRNSAGSPTVFDLFGKASATDIASTWASFTSLSGAGGYRANSLTYYGGKTYILDTSFNVRRYDGAWTNEGSVDVSATWSTMLVPRPFVHPLDDILYFAGNQALAKIDGTTYSDISSVTVPSTLVVSSLTDYGSDLAIACTPLYSDISRVFLWDRNTATTTFRENIPWGEDSLLILENIDGVLVGVSINEKSYEPTASYTTVKNKKVTVRAYQGGTPRVIKEIDVPDTFSLRNYKQKVGSKLYFGGDNDDSLFVVYKNKFGDIVVSRDRLLNNGDVITTLRGFSLIGDYLFTMFDTASTTGNVYRTKVTSTYSSVSTYESLINPNMTLDDRTKLKKLKFVSVAKDSTTGQLAVYVSIDGAAYVAVVTLAASGKLVKKETKTATGIALPDGYEFQFKVESTDGSEMTEVKYAYEVTEKNI